MKPTILYHVHGKNHIAKVSRLLRIRLENISTPSYGFRSFFDFWMLCYRYAAYRMQHMGHMIYVTKLIAYGSYDTVCDYILYMICYIWYIIYHILYMVWIFLSKSLKFQSGNPKLPKNLPLSSKSEFSGSEQSQANYTICQIKLFPFHADYTHISPVHVDVLNSRFPIMDSR